MLDVIVGDCRRSLQKQKWIVYILKCCDNTFYIGCTSDLTDRMKRHSRGQILYTKNRYPFELVTYCVFNNKYKAFRFEKYLKSGSGRAFSKRHLY